MYMNCQFKHNLISVQYWCFTSTYILPFPLSTKQMKTVASLVSNQREHQLSWDNFDFFQNSSCYWCTILQFHQTLPTPWSSICLSEYLAAHQRTPDNQQAHLSLPCSWNFCNHLYLLEASLLVAQVTEAQDSKYLQPFLIVGQDLSCHCCNNLLPQNLLVLLYRTHREGCSQMLCFHDIQAVLGTSAAVGSLNRFVMLLLTSCLNPMFLLSLSLKFQLRLPLPMNSNTKHHLQSLSWACPNKEMIFGWEDNLCKISSSSCFREAVSLRHLIATNLPAVQTAL